MGGMEDDDGHLTKTGRGVNTMFDPLDLFGTRAKDTQDAMQDIIEQSAMDSLKSAKKRYKKITKLQDPFVKYGASAVDDDSIKPFSQQYHRDMREGGRLINRSLAGSGLSDSSFAGEKLTDFALDMANQEIASQHQDRLNKMRIGQYAAGMTGQAGQQLGNSAVNIAGSQAQGTQELFNAYGAQRNASLQSAGNAFANFGSAMD